MLLINKVVIERTERGDREWPAGGSQMQEQSSVLGQRSRLLQASIDNRKSAIHQPPQDFLKLNFLPLTRNVVDNKGPDFR
jgi:hypothetical protein